MEQSSCSTSVISAFSAALRISAFKSAPRRWQKGCKNKKKKTGLRQSQSRRPRTWLQLSRQVLRLWTIRLRRKAPGFCTQSTLSNRLVKYRETWRKRSQRRPGTPELSWRFRKYRETCRPRKSRKLRKLRNRRQCRRLTTQFPYFNKLRAAHWGGFLDRETKIRCQPYRANEEPRCEHSFLVYIHVCHCSSCSLSWERSHRKSAICQESTLEIFETVISGDWKVDHGSNRNYWTDHDWWAAACVERDDSVNWQSCSICNCQNLRLFWLSALSGRHQWRTSRSRKNKTKWYLDTRYLKDSNRIDGESMEFEWKKFPGFTTLGILEEIQKLITELQCEPEQFKRRIIFMSMYNDILWGGTRKQIKLYCECYQGYWACSGMKTTHFNDSGDTIELILRTVLSGNQFSVYGAVADLCKELARDPAGAGKPATNENLESMVIPTEFLIANPISEIDAEMQRKLLRECDHKFAELLEQQKLTKLCSNAGFSMNVDKGQFFITLDVEGLDDMKT